MLTPEEELNLAGEKIRQLLLLADDIVALRQTVNASLSDAIQEGSFQYSARNCVCIGLWIKALDSFDRLLVDARDRRAESSHHLKTMAESFIYTGWVSGDTGDTRAKMVCAAGFRSRAAYHRALEEEDSAVEYDQLQRQEVEGIEKEWKEFRSKKIEELSSIANRTEHYHKVYRFACEAAHLGDLKVYMPPQPTDIGSRLSDLSLLRAYVCLKFGISLACDLLRDASDSLGMRLDQQLEGFRERGRTIVALSSPVRDE